MYLVPVEENQIGLQLTHFAIVMSSRLIYQRVSKLENMMKGYYRLRFWKKGGDYKLNIERNHLSRD